MRSLLLVLLVAVAMLYGCTLFLFCVYVFVGLCFAILHEYDQAHDADNAKEHGLREATHVNYN